jgi:crossover junction endodeoxyribonuclease RusA
LELYFRIDGAPATQGSKTAYVRGGRAVLVESNKKLPEWRKAVSEAALLALADQQLVKPFQSPVKVVITFFLPRPAKPKHERYPGSKPDLDKLVRAVLDGCLPVWADDSLAVEIHARKLWCGTSTDTYQNPGCSVYITEK